MAAVASRREQVERELRTEVEAVFNSQMVLCLHVVSCRLLLLQQAEQTVSHSGLSALITALTEKEDLIDMLNSECQSLVCVLTNLASSPTFTSTRD
jgi:hypothetical protein